MARKLKYDIERAIKEWQTVVKGPAKSRIIKKIPGNNAVWGQIHTDKAGHSCYGEPKFGEATDYVELRSEWKGTVFEQILNDYNAYCARFRIMPPNTTLAVHTDGWTPSLYVYMFPILTNKDSFFIVQTEDKSASFTHAWNAWHHPADGSVYKTRYDIPHAAMNGGTTPKVNLQVRSKDDL